MVQKSSLAAADLRAAGAIQHLGAAIVTGVLAAVMAPAPGTIADAVVLAAVVGRRVVAGRHRAVYRMVRHGDLIALPR